MMIIKKRMKRTNKKVKREQKIKTEKKTERN